MKTLLLLVVAILALALASPMMSNNGYTTSYDSNGNMIYRDAQGRQITKQQYYDSMYMYGMDGSRMYDNTYPYNYNYNMMNNMNNQQYQQQQRMNYPYNYNTMSQATTPYYNNGGK